MFSLRNLGCKVQGYNVLNGRQVAWIGLGLELMPFGQVPTGRATTHHGGQGPSGPRPVIQHPHQFLFGFNPDQQLLPAPPDSKKAHPCILEGHLSTNPIWNARHLEGPKFYIYVCVRVRECAHFPFVNKQLIEISFPKKVTPKACKWISIKHVVSLEATKITKSSSTLRL